MSSCFGGGGLLLALAAITSLHGGGCNEDTVEAVLADADIAAVKGDQQPAFGLGADAQVAVASPLWPTLQQRWIDGAWSVSTARTVFYIGLDDEPMDTSNLHGWVTAVLQAGLEPMVGISLHHTKWASLLPRPEFRARFETLLHEFPDVVYWSVVNEPDLDLPGSQTERAGTAVEYFVDGWHVLRSCKQQHKCSSVKLVAGEFSYQGAAPSESEAFWEEYGKKLLNAQKNHQILAFPRIWAFHPYTDTSGASTDGTGRFVKFLDTLEDEAGLAKNSLRAWLTESGTLLHRGSTCATSVGDLNNNPQAQYNGAYTVYYLNDIQRVDRIYWWHFQQGAGHPWDSAMVDSNGIPRPSFCALTNQPIDACSGNPAATQCESDPSPSPCGGPCPTGFHCDGNACQPDSSPPCGGPCPAGFYCDGANCVGCGNAGDLCCGGACSTDRLNCNGVCQSCGDPKLPCCVSGAQCNAVGTACYGGTCGAACYARCMDGTLQGPYAAADTNDCLNWSDAACAGDGGKGRVELNMVNIFDNKICGAFGQLCCAAAKCNAGLSCQTGPQPLQRQCR